MSLRVFISDSTSGGTHGEDVKDAISFGYGSDISAQITLRLNGSYSSSQILADMEEAYNAGYEAFVQSAFGPTAFIEAAKDYYPTMLCFSPLGSNSSVLISDPASVPGIVTSGAGDTDNDTAYGPGLEFWDDDNDGNPNNDASSFSNGTVCGKLLKIKDGRGGSWWDARYSARQTASGSGSRTNANGYGQIDTTSAIAFAGLVIDDPFLRPVASFSASATSGIAPITVTFTNLTTGADSYLWDFGDSETSAEENPQHTFSTVGSYTVTLTATNDNGDDVESLGISALSRPHKSDFSPRYSSVVHHA